ncbi:class I SAM-dependent RNA methyltransferase [Candidatus Viridilinea mediisalina]|uniref:23S rRNA (Uracil-5-)-methyltransferase RumA n=1 Tax=Candidatus Viridilinea mediisalina TaxID=2024553 RepID=A0A2A6RKS1_9CHLR|nr:class I SAM-dependent RNA methyltransferase [Candidatus Viridilinea mediisalina]PDW03533.1 23S rRNA (uracil-5-)-methyltransferase RumA [Candidatus Viridilinea mediisalina]
MRAKEFRQLVTTLAREGAPVEPRCPHANECGGCAFQDRTYADQVAAKASALSRVFAAAGIPLPTGPQVSVVPSPDPFSYRTRMDYVATKGRFGLRARGKFNFIIELQTCHLIPPSAFAVAHKLWLTAQILGLPDYNVRSHVGFLRYIVVRRSPNERLLLAAVTAAGAYDEAMEQLAATALAQPQVASFYWLLNDSLTDLSFGQPLRHWGQELLTMGSTPGQLLIGPNTFFQNNIHLLDQLCAAVLAATTASGKPVRVADLYGGVGTLALHLAPHVGMVDCVEAVAESAALAERNGAAAGITNFRAIAQDVLPFLREQSPAAYPVVVADPPRTGLGPEVCAELLRLGPQRIIYVSCNPLTQCEDLHVLAAAYRLTALTGYDMFPHTPHVETLAILERHV